MDPGVQKYHDVQSLGQNQLKPFADQLSREEGLPVFHEGPIRANITRRYTQVRVDRANQFMLVRTTPLLERVFRTTDKRLIHEKEEEMAAHFFMMAQYGQACFEGKRLAYSLSKLEGTGLPDFETVLHSDDIQIEVTNIADPRATGQQQFWRERYGKQLTARFPDRAIIGLFEDEITEPQLARKITHEQPIAMEGSYSIDATKSLIDQGRRNILIDITDCDDVTEAFADIEFIGEQFPSYTLQVIDAIERKAQKRYASHKVDLVIIDKTSSTPRYRRDAKSGLLQMYALSTPFRRIVIISPFTYKPVKGVPQGEFWHMKIKDAEDSEVFHNIVFANQVFIGMRPDWWQFTNPGEAKDILKGFYG